MGTKWIWFILFLVFLLQFFLHGCGRKELDPETLALAEESQAVCRASPLLDDGFQPNSRIPGKRLLFCLLMADYRGNLSEAGTDLNRYDSQYIYVMLDMAEYEAFVKEPAAMVLFLDLSGTEYGGCSVLVPHGKAGQQKDGRDRASMEREELLRAWGKAHPGVELENASRHVEWGNLQFDFGSGPSLPY